ncbi:zinc transport system substrate-binding protein [Halopelagius inordinatus]|uniref:Zinc transport system substrate-binding protein n=1 Tax=Halopelagius inordinatus TaxID=553467 RepID=A0A1I2RUW9_9EURY|nr:zinc ABC transporter substrate-binding protein [Halopelagius inordinatus]SFG44280.1 zinc transport system substrate-binding protein [Halopelagius inordinatus]
MRQTRRRFLGATGVAMGAVTGCLGSAATDSTSGGASSDGSKTAQASFFVVSDFATRVAEGAAAVENLVPFGQHGHGWEPGPEIQRDVLGSDALVYVGEGFQPWADNVVRNVREDGADVAVIEAWEDVDLLEATDDRDHESESGDDHESDGDGHESDGDGHSEMDPHFWLDPDRAKQSVETIADGLASVDPDDESAYAENADAFADRLTTLDETFETRLDGRTRDAVLVAGHNSFRYLGRRYDFRVEALSGLAPDSTPSPKDITRAQGVIDRHDVEYVLAPVFESDRAATQLVEETDATGVLPLTPVPSLTEEWTEEGWGYVDVMENVNLPSLAKALGAE